MPKANTAKGPGNNRTQGNGTSGRLQRIGEPSQRRLLQQPLPKGVRDGASCQPLR